jgi:hypothetical protein
MSESIVKRLSTPNRSRIKQVWIRFKRKTIANTIANVENTTKIIQFWTKSLDRFRNYPERIINISYCINMIAKKVNEIETLDEIIICAWYSFIFDVVKQLHTPEHFKWLTDHKNNKLWSEFTESMDSFLRIVPESYKVSWKSVLFDGFYQVFVDTSYYFATEFMHACMKRMNDYFSFLTYRCPDRMLVLSPNIPILFDYTKIPEFFWNNMLTCIVNYFVSAFNIVDSSELLQSQIMTKIKTFEIIYGTNLIQFFQFLNYRISKHALMDEALLKPFLKIMEIINVVCCLNDESALGDIIKKCWTPATTEIHSLWSRVFNKCIHEDIDDPIILFTLLSTVDKKVGKDMLTILFFHVKELRMSRVINDRRGIYTWNLKESDLIKEEVNNALACFIPDPISNAVSRAIFNIISESGVHVDDIEDIIEKWGKGKILETLKGYRKRRSSFLECGKELNVVDTCCICYRDDRNMFICAPCGHMFCVICGPLRLDRCHICKTNVDSRVNKVYSNTD